MNDLQQADRLIREGVDAFNLAAAKTASGIIEQGLAVLKIFEGCEVRSGGTDFPDVAMRELGLSKSAACKFLRIGKEHDKLFPIRNSLPGDAFSSVYEVARMEPEIISEKLDRGVITPTATVAQILEKEPRKRVVVEQKHDNTELAKDFAGVLSKLKDKEKKILRAQYAADLKSAVDTARAEAKEQLASARKEREQNAQARSELHKARRLVQEPFTAGEFNKIRGMLHPDKHPGNEARAKEAFELFLRIRPICNKADLKAV